MKYELANSAVPRFFLSSTSVSAVSASLRMANAGMEGKASHVVQRSNASSRQRFQPARRTVKITAPVPAQSEPASTGASVLLTWPLTTGCRLTPPSLATLRLPTAEASHIGPASELAALMRCSFARSLSQLNVISRLQAPTPGRLGIL